VGAAETEIEEIPYIFPFAIARGSHIASSGFSWFAPKLTACPPQKLSRRLEMREIKTDLKGKHRQ
jgi:hypothetical protein